MKPESRKCKCLKWNEGGPYEPHGVMRCFSCRKWYHLLFGQKNGISWLCGNCSHKLHDWLDEIQEMGLV